MTARADLFTATDLARFCDVDAKTIHNWAAKAKIAHHRTGGRHLRFRRVDVVDFLKRYEYPIPGALLSARPRVVAIDPDAASMAGIRRAIGRRFDLHAYADALCGFIALGNVDPDALVIDDAPFGVGGLGALDCVSRVRAMPTTRHVRIVVVTTRPERADAALRAGANEIVPKPEWSRLRESLERILGATG
jgi:PleD family two-component response regulator